jgi:hypothetical protein
MVFSQRTLQRKIDFNNNHNKCSKCLLHNSFELSVNLQIIQGVKSGKSGKDMLSYMVILRRHANKWNQESKSL